MVLLSLLAKSPNTCLQGRTQLLGKQGAAAGRSTSPPACLPACLSEPHLNLPGQIELITELRDKEPGKENFHPIHLPGIRSQKCVPLVARHRKGGEPPQRGLCACHPSFQFLRDKRFAPSTH